MDPAASQQVLTASMEYLPPGFRFSPTDEEAVVYLRGHGCYGGVTVIPQVDIYQREPVELPLQFQELSIVRSSDLEGWFLSKQEPGRTAKRSTKGGFWKITGQHMDVKNRYSGELIARKKFLTFYRKEQGMKEVKTNWVMHEYNLPDGNVRDFVLCHVMLKDKLLDLMDEIVDASFPEDSIQETMDSLLEQDSGQTTMEWFPAVNEVVSVDSWSLEVESAVLSRRAEYENGISLADLIYP